MLEKKWHLAKGAPGKPAPKGRGFFGRRLGQNRGRGSNVRRAKSAGPNFKALFPPLKRLLKVGGVALGVSLAVILISAGLVAGYFYLVRADYFAIRTVNITGLDRVARESVLKAAGLDWPGNILDVRLDKMEKAVENLPWVAKAAISRVMPDTLAMEIVEYRPKSLVNLGTLYYLDVSGRPFKKVEPGENPDLPIVSGFSQADLLEWNQAVTDGLAEVFSLMEILEARQDGFRLNNISEIHFDQIRGLTIFTRDEGLQVKVGSGRFEEKINRLGRVVAWMKNNGQYAGLVYLNLECAPRVVARHKRKAV